MNGKSMRRGRLCLTFDDRNFKNWINSLPLWRKYDAHATFFVSGKIDEEALTVMHRLQDEGHSVGLHALHHVKAAGRQEDYIAGEIMPQLSVCRQNGIGIRAFAYPYSSRDENIDRMLFEHFDLLRGGAAQILMPGENVAEKERFFVPDVAEKQLFYGSPVSGNFDFDTVQRCFRRAAGSGEVIVFYAHDVVKKVAPSHHISFGQLEVLLKLARALNMNICGMNEL